MDRTQLSPSSEDEGAGGGANGQTTHRVVVRFAVPGVWVHPDLLGTDYCYPARGSEAEIRIQLPRDVSDFIPTDEPETTPIPAFSPAPGNRGPALSLNLIKVSVTLRGHGTYQQKTLLGIDKFDVLQARIKPSWEEGLAVAQSEAQRFLAWVRVLMSQIWLGLAEEPLDQYGRAHLFDVDAAERLVSYGPTQAGTAFGNNRALTAAASEVLSSHLASATPVPIAATLLADADYMQHGRATVDAHRAVLAAAMSCEISLKETLRALSRPSAAALADLALKGQSNLGGLSSDVAAAIVGRDLRAEDPELFKRVRELASVRNAIVHEGLSIDPQRSHGLVATARQLHAWLGDIRASCADDRDLEL